MYQVEQLDVTPHLLWPLVLQILSIYYGLEEEDPAIVWMVFSKTPLSFDQMQTNVHCSLGIH